MDYHEITETVTVADVIAAWEDTLKETITERQAQDWLIENGHAIQEAMEQARQDAIYDLLDEIYESRR